MEVRLVDVDQRHLVATHAGESLLQPGDVLGPLGGLGLAQQLLDLLPAQLGGEQHPADRIASHPAAERVQDPLPELLQGPAVAGQAVVDRLGGGDDLDELAGLIGRKKGAGPPVRR